VQRPGKRALGLATLAALALATAAHGSGPSRVIQGNQKIGPFAPYLDHGKLSQAIDAFGKPASLTSRPGLYECVARWPALGLTIVFNNVCASETCFLNAVVTGRGWRTAKGLHIGDSRTRLSRLYPRAKARGAWRGLLVEPGFAEGTYFALGARLVQGRVTAFRVETQSSCEA
jgi:hypothetical protein